jgi:hypothetical protein
VYGLKPAGGDEVAEFLLENLIVEIKTNQQRKLHHDEA